MGLSSALRARAWHAVCIACLGAAWRPSARPRSPDTLHPPTSPPPPPLLLTSPPHTFRSLPHHSHLQDAEKEDYEEKLKEVQDVCGPIISKVYAAAGGEGGAGGEEDDDLGDHTEL